MEDLAFSPSYNSAHSPAVPPFPSLKVPKCEIFEGSDFDDFYTIKSLCEGDFGVLIKNFI